MRLRIVRTGSYPKIFAEDGTDLTEKLPVTKITWECNGESGFMGGRVTLELLGDMVDFDILAEDIKLEIANLARPVTKQPRFYRESRE